MADTPKAPTPPRRKAATGTRKTTRATPPKATAPAAEGSAAGAAVKTAATRKAPAKRATTAKTPARKPASPKSTATRARSTAAKVTATATTAANKVADTAASARDAVTHSAPAQLVSDTRERMGDRNFFAAVIGGAAAIGAAVGGIFYALRDGNPDKPGGKKPKA